MVVEWLKFAVPETKRQAFLERDAVVWTGALSRVPGFIKKEIWLEENAVIAVIHWQSLSAWQVVSADECQRLDNQMGDLKMPLLESKAFEVVS